MINKAKEYKTAIYLRGGMLPTQEEDIFEFVSNYNHSHKNEKLHVLHKFAEYWYGFDGIAEPKDTLDGVLRDFKDEIDCIIVKNFFVISKKPKRLKRVVKLFIKNNIRFISLDDNYDNLEELRKAGQ